MFDWEILNDMGNSRQISSSVASPGAERGIVGDAAERAAADTSANLDSTGGGFAASREMEEQEDGFHEGSAALGQDFQYRYAAEHQGQRLIGPGSGAVDFTTLQSEQR